MVLRSVVGRPCVFWSVPPTILRGAERLDLEAARNAMRLVCADATRGHGCAALLCVGLRNKKRLQFISAIAHVDGPSNIP